MVRGGSGRGARRGEGPGDRSGSGGGSGDGSGSGSGDGSGSTQSGAGRSGGAGTRLRSGDRVMVGAGQGHLFIIRRNSRWDLNIAPRGRPHKTGDSAGRRSVTEAGTAGKTKAADENVVAPASARLHGALGTAGWLGTMTLEAARRQALEEVVVNDMAPILKEIDFQDQRFRNRMSQQRKNDEGGASGHRPLQHTQQRLGGVAHQIAQQQRWNRVLVWRLPAALMAACDATAAARALDHRLLFAVKLHQEDAVGTFRQVIKGVRGGPSTIRHGSRRSQGGRGGVTEEDLLGDMPGDMMSRAQPHYANTLVVRCDPVDDVAEEDGSLAATAVTADGDRGRGGGGEGGGGLKPIRREYRMDYGYAFRHRLLHIRAAYYRLPPLTFLHNDGAAGADDSEGGGPFMSVEPRVLGSAVLSLESILHLLDIDETTPVIDFKGDPIGDLTVQVAPFQDLDCTQHFTAESGTFHDKIDNWLGRRIYLEVCTRHASGFRDKIAASSVSYTLYGEHVARTTSRIHRKYYEVLTGCLAVFNRLLICRIHREYSTIRRHICCDSPGGPVARRCGSEVACCD